MTTCQHCRAATQLYLCDNCTIQLANMLDEIPWLLDELDARIQKLDRISVGTIGRSRRPDHLDVMDFDAADTARAVRKTLLHWVQTIAEHHSGRRPAALTSASTKDLARWLSANTAAIARIDLAKKGRHPLFDDIAHLVGTNQRGGQLVTAINPQEKHLVGPCPTVTGRERDGTPRQCGHTLFADTYDKTTTCPDCHHDIDVEETRKQAAADRDLHTKGDLLELLDSINEPVTEERFDLWVSARQLRPRGYRHDGAIREFRIADTDEPLYSVDRAQRLRRRDQNLRQRRRASA